MNELNIYTNFNYKEILKKTNLYFNNYYTWYNYKTIFAPEKETYSISLNKWNIRICYWDENTEKGKRSKEFVKKFIQEVLSGQMIEIICVGTCDILDELVFVKKIQLG